MRTRDNGLWMLALAGLLAGCEGSGTRSSLDAGVAGSGGIVSTGGLLVSAGGDAAVGGQVSSGGLSTFGGAVSSSDTSGGGDIATTGGKASAGAKASTAGASSTGGTARTGGVGAGGTSSAGGVASTGGVLTTGGTTRTGGTVFTGGSTAMGGATSGTYACPGTATGYNAVMVKSGTTWTVSAGGTEKYSGDDTTAALTAAYNSLTAGRTSKQSILVQGDGDIPASAQVVIPSYTVLNWCGTLNVSDTPSGSDRSPLYARNKTDIEIPNLKMTGSPQYGIFFRGTSNIKLGRIDMQLTLSAGIGVRVDTSGSAGTDTTFVKNLTIDHISGGGMGSHLVETYGVDQIKIGLVEANAAGECGLLLNRSINAEVGTVSCTDCAKGTGYAAFRVANSVGKVNGEFPAGNIHVKKVYARGGGRGIFSVSGCGGLTIDNIDIANTGNTSILLQNTYNTTIAAESGTVVGGVVQISNDTKNTENGTYPPSQNVAIKNLVLSGGASVRQDWCAEYGANGCTASDVTGGTVSMCK